MPFTPFIGLSVSFHILMIIIFKVFNLTPRVERTLKHLAVAKSWPGLIIITVVFSLVFASAVILVNASITEQHSSVNFVVHHYVVFKNFFDQSLNYVSAAAINK